MSLFYIWFKLVQNKPRISHLTIFVIRRVLKLWNPNNSLYQIFSQFRLVESVCTTIEVNVKTLLRLESWWNEKKICRGSHVIVTRQFCKVFSVMYVNTSFLLLETKKHKLCNRSLPSNLFRVRMRSNDNKIIIFCYIRFG